MPAVATHADAIRMEISGVETPQLHHAGTLDGVAIAFVAGRNGPGTGYLASDSSGTSVAWKAPGSSSYGTYIDVSAGGSFVLEDGDDPDCYVRVTVTASRLPESIDEARVLLMDRYGNGVSHDDVTAGEAAAGDVTTHTITLTNDSNVSVSHVKAWLDAAVSGLEISNDGASWASATTEATGIDIDDIPGNGGTKTLHLRRTIGAGAPADADVLNHIHLAFDGV